MFRTDSGSASAVLRRSATCIGTSAEVSVVIAKYSFHSSFSDARSDRRALCNRVLIAPGAVPSRSAISA